jgi:hypothetical protein
MELEIKKEKRKTGRETNKEVEDKQFTSLTL